MALFARVAVKAATFAIDRPYDYGVPEAFQETISPGMRVVVPFGAGNKKTEGVVLAVGGVSAHEKVKSIHRLLDDAPVLDEDMIKLALWMRERAFCTVYEAARAMLPAGLWFSFEETCSLLPGVDREEASRMLDEKAQSLLDMLYASGGAASRADIEAVFGEKAMVSLVKTLTNKGLAESSIKAVRKTGDKTALIVSPACAAEEAAAALTQSAAAKRRAVMEFLAENGPAPARDIEYFTGCSRKTLRTLERDRLVYFSDVEVFRVPRRDGQPAAGPVELNGEQQAAYDRLAALVDAGRPACGLLYGVTGSGKTSVYIRLIRHTIEAGGSALVMVPEIALTPQLMERFSAHFGDRVAILHSGLSGGERLDEFKRIRRGLADVVIGTRSAVFAPLPVLKLVILDEEHDGSYKSSSVPRYHARDVAKFRCVQAGATLVLGSATPSVESMWSARTGKIQIDTLRCRYSDSGLPSVDIVDMRAELKSGNASTISAPLYDALDETIRQGRQSILFLNRRGASSQLLCGDCGHVPQCPRCTMALTVHSANNRLMCHLCGHSEKKPERCPACAGALRPLGAGTQKVIEELAALFPGVAALRMDADTTSGKGAHAAILEQFRTRRVPILVGTQMVTKGLDIENVLLVGVLSADGALYADDFRANERVFAQITQVVGRAGRGALPGRAIVQTFHPNHPVILAAAKQDYDGFYEQEIELRQTRGLAPFGALTTLTLFGPMQDDVLRACLRVLGWLGPHAEAAGLRLLGPAPARVLRVNLQYRYLISLLGDDGAPARRLISNTLSAFAVDRRNKGVHMYADPNPYD